MKDGLFESNDVARLFGIWNTFQKMFVKFHEEHKMVKILIEHHWIYRSIV